MLSFRPRVLGDAVACRSPEARREAVSLLAHLSTTHRARRLIANSACLMPLLELASSPDPETSRNALGALANLAEDAETHRLLIFKAAALPPLIKLMRSKMLSIVRESSRAVANLLVNWHGHPVLMRA